MKEEEIRKKLKLLNNKMFDPTLSDSEFITLAHIVRDYLKQENSYSRN
ncbi:unnamed protein product [marine sediment metagenome]|uniref:Uncharacterized protein n=1 Tax=marine sediment metagenome TaxID=412755 RepID=X1C6Z4_9ZZZZ